MLLEFLRNVKYILIKVTIILIILIYERLKLRTTKSFA